MVGNIIVRVVKQKGVSRVVGVTAYVVAQEAPEPSAAPEVAKEPDVAPGPSASTRGAEPEASKAPEVEPAPSASGSRAIELSTQAPKSPVRRAGESLLASSSVVRREASNPVDQNLEGAFDRIRSLVQVTLLDPFPLLPSPQVFS